MFSPSHNFWNSQEAVQQQRRGSLPLWQHDTHLNDQSGDGFGPCLTTSGTGPAHSILPNGYDSSGSFERHSQLGTMDSDHSSNTSYSAPSNIDPALTQRGSPWEYPYQNLTDMQLVASPDQLTTTASESFLPPRQGDLSTQATGYSADQSGGYFVSHPNYVQPLLRQEQQVASGPQDGGFYSNPAMVGPAPSPPLHQPTHHDKKPSTVADFQSPSLYVCPDCGAKCKRLTDLLRHQSTATRHGDPRGPTCPVPSCKYTKKFTRCDNFKVHFKRHWENEEESIQQWDALVSTGFLARWRRESMA